MNNKDRMEKYQRWREVFGTPQGTLVLAELCRICGYDHSGFTTGLDGNVDPYMMAIHTGRRQIYLEIKKNLTEPKDLPDDTDED